jgi:hypothetical protein
MAWLVLKMLELLWLLWLWLQYFFYLGAIALLRSRRKHISQEPLPDQQPAGQQSRYLPATITTCHGKILCKDFVRFRNLILSPFYQ